MSYGDEIEDRIWNWANAVLNPTGTEPDAVVPIIWANGRRPRPNKAHVQFRIIGMPYRGALDIGPVHVPVDPETEEPIPAEAYSDRQREIELTLSVQGFGDGARGYLETLVDSLDEPEWRDVFVEEGLSARGSAGITDIAEIMDEGPEKRWAADIMFGVAKVKRRTGVTYIEQVEYSGVFPT